jgi:hypothetical protein
MLYKSGSRAVVRIPFPLSRLIGIEKIVSALMELESAIPKAETRVYQRESGNTTLQ